MILTLQSSLDEQEKTISKLREEVKAERTMAHLSDCKVNNGPPTIARSPLTQSQLAEARNSGLKWQPIETAPKNGEWILLGWFEFPGQKGMEVAFWNRIKDTWCGAYAVFNTKGYPTPTHWQPLPDPPAIRALKSQDGKK